MAADRIVMTKRAPIAAENTSSLHVDNGLSKMVLCPVC